MMHSISLASATKTKCQDCEVLPPPVADSGTLLLASADPLGLAETLRELGVVSASEAGLLTVPLTVGTLDRLASSASAEPQRWDARALVMAEGCTPTPLALMAARPVADLFAAVRGRWLAELLRENRLTTYFQPIVTADNPNVTHGYECLLRGIDLAREPVPPGRLFAAARDAGLLYHLDRSARITAIRSAMKHRISARLFINFYPTAIYNPATCLRTTFRATAEVGLDPSRVVFEVVESEEVRDTQHLIDLLAEYRRNGFRVALDDVGAGYSSLNLLARLQPDYVKIDMGLVRGVDTDRYKGEVVGKLLEMCKALGIESIAEGVESKGEWEWLRHHNATYVQGYLFARPSAEPTVPVGW